jgi:predicted nucleotidyltransferase
MSVLADPNPIVALKALEPELRARGVTSLSVFGSRARGDSRPGSDIDVLIDVNPDAKMSAFDWVGLCDLIGEDLGITANVFFNRSLDPEFRKEISGDIRHVF